MTGRIIAWLPVLICGLLIALALWPHLDLTVSGWFYHPVGRFYLENKPVFLALHWFGTKGAWIMAGLLALGLLYTLIRRRPLWGADSKGWLYLLLALLLIPGLMANTLLKDHWGRARPVQVAQFGGTAAFTPYYIPQPNPHRNESFVAGDPAFGFYLPCLAFIFRLKRYPHLLFWGGMGMGGLLGVTRLVMGAHFLSDILCAAVFTLIGIFGLYALMYGPRAARDCWRQQMGLNH